MGFLISLGEAQLEYYRLRRLQAEDSPLAQREDRAPENAARVSTPKRGGRDGTRSWMPEKTILRNNRDDWREKARSIRQTARRLGEKSMEEFEPGDRAYLVQSRKSTYWRFASLEAATAMAECLVRMDRAPGTRHSYTRRSGRIDCFELLVFPESIGPVPTRLLVWNRDAGDWTETWSGNAAGHGAAMEKRKRSTPTTVPTM